MISSVQTLLLQPSSHCEFSFLLNEFDAFSMFIFRNVVHASLSERQICGFTVPYGHNQSGRII
jgi:hypothetical protein